MKQDDLNDSLENQKESLHKSDNSSLNQNLSNISSKITILLDPNKANLEIVRQNSEIGSNKVSTTRYTFLTWIPKSLLIQFFKLANIYFLIITILTYFPFSPKQPSTMTLAMVTVLLVSMLKEGYEDYRRYKSDQILNNSKSSVYMNGKWTSSSWGELKVGDVVMIKRDEQIPADLFAIESSNSNGICFVDTKNIDGETNLKEKYVNDEFKNLKYDLKGKILCDKANEILDVWNASIFIEKHSSDALSLNENIQTHLSIKHLFLRGSDLKNTNYLIGVIIYPGHSSKIMKNAKSPQFKISNVILKMNKILNSLFIFQFLVVVSYSLLNILFSIRNNNYLSHYIIGLDTTYSFKDPIINFFTYFVAYSSIVPISLYVSLEFLKLGQGIFVQKDNYMKYENKTAICKTIDLIEELGQVEFVFSDKTGTLTKNEMIFKYCAVGEKVYGNQQINKNLTTSFVSNNNKGIEDYNINGDTSAKCSLENRDSESISLELFFRAICLCHSSISEKLIDEETGMKKFIYSSASTDEVALLNGANKMGFIFKEKSNKFLTFYNRYYKKGSDKYLESWELLYEIPFDSIRKRMSVLVKNSNNDYFVFSKGADNEMIKLTELDNKNSDFCKSVLYDFSCDGLRTLMIAGKQLNADDGSSMFEKIKKLKLANKTEDLEVIHHKLESNLSLIGITAIEDKLQEGVPETIEILINSNIRVWVLTGDKKETALNISKTCRLFEEIGVNEFNFTDCNSVGELELKIDEIITMFQIGDVEDAKLKNMEKKYYLIIDGKSLSFVLSEEIMKVKFFKVGLICRSVICCRVSPKQKSEVVSLSKYLKDNISLAIGDGANDVPMIMQAEIGIGIIGKEGTQAVRSSDYSIAQFKFLQRLLFIHGRDGYYRITNYILYYFYKNIIIVFADMCFVFLSGYSGQLFFSANLTLFYNFLWTSWPCLFAFTFDKELSLNYKPESHNLMGQHFLQMISLYQKGQKNERFNFMVFWKWVIYSFVHGGFGFFIICFGVNNDPDTGSILNHWVLSTIIFTCVLIVGTIKLFVVVNHWNIIMISISFYSLILYFFSLFIISLPSVSFYLGEELSFIFHKMMTSRTFWFCLFTSTTLSILPNLIERIIKELCFPDENHIVENTSASKQDSISVRGKTDIIRRISKIHDPRDGKKTFIHNES